VAANAFASLNKLAPGRIDFRSDRLYRQAGDGRSGSPKLEENIRAFEQAEQTV
jgi:hypothetical protein